MPAASCSAEEYKTHDRRVKSDIVYINYLREQAHAIHEALSYPHVIIVKKT